MYYDHINIEKKWQKYWAENKTFKTESTQEKPKYYVLDMFPYPSGAGLHVGHPLGYIASDIVSRYKRHQGFNVLHPIGYDSFGLPAEQYAIQTGQHPAVTTAQNIARYETQLKRLGFSFDWSRQFQTSEPSYYKFTQWIFIQLFHSWYNFHSDQAEGIETLKNHLAKWGTTNLNAASGEKQSFTAEEWNAKSEVEQEEILLNFRLAFRAETTVNWCPGLGTVLANDEVVDGRSERGGFPVFQKKMMQWSMRISAYSERLLQGLEDIDWPQPLKETQKNWIGKSQGAEIDFEVENNRETIRVFTTRPDTIFGSTFMVLAPEHPLVKNLTTVENQQAVEQYIEETAKRSERDRMADVKAVSGAFTGSYAINPFTKKKMPVYISDYILMGYGTGAVMAVPAHDERDHRFAKKFDLEIVEVIKGGDNVQDEAYSAKEGTYINSDFLNGMTFQDALPKIIGEIENIGVGKATINYRQRDAIFARQRYWGEPIPIYYKKGMPYTLPETALPLELPEVEKYLPTEDGEPPLGNALRFAWDEKTEKVVATDFIDHQSVFPLELSTMPGWAGSSWYFLRYMDPHNDTYFADKVMTDYWGQVDLYMGGSEHATGHLLYSRFWNKFLKDRGYLEQEEPFKKLINQGMILGMSAFVFRIEGTNRYVSRGLAKDYKTQKIHVDVTLLKGGSDELDVEGFKNWRPEFNNSEFILEGGKYITEREVEKMSKSKFNVLNPDEVCEEYGADCLRMYEMFLGPLEQSKPWNTQGLSGVYGFLKRFWNLYFNENDEFSVADEEPTKEEYRILHTLIQKVTDSIESFSFNTGVSAFMIAVNDFTKLKTSKRKILTPMAVLLSSFAPHIAEEVWGRLGHVESIEFAEFPKWEAEYLILDEIDYPVSFNGKMRFKISLNSDLSRDEIQEVVLNHPKTIAYLAGNNPKKIIVVPKKIVNFVM